MSSAASGASLLNELEERNGAAAPLRCDLCRRTPEDPDKSASTSLTIFEPLSLGCEQASC